MSFEVLQRLVNYLTNKGLVPGLSAKYYRWTDTDLQESADFYCVRYPGTSGPLDDHVQQPDVEITVVGHPSNIIATHDLASGVFNDFAETVYPTGFYKIQPLGVVMGPMMLANDRCAFKFNARLFVEAGI